MYWVSRDRWFVVCLQVLWSAHFCVLGQQRQMVCCVFAGLVESVFLRIGSAETDDLLVVAGLVECVFLRIGSAETDGLFCVSK